MFYFIDILLYERPPAIYTKGDTVSFGLLRSLKNIDNALSQKTAKGPYVEDIACKIYQKWNSVPFFSREKSKLYLVTSNNNCNGTFSFLISEWSNWNKLIFSIPMSTKNKPKNWENPNCRGTTQIYGFCWLHPFNGVQHDSRLK